MATLRPCLGCRARPMAIMPMLSFTSTQQCRSKSGIHRPSGVVVRLTADVPFYGPTGTVLRTERGRMRNQWYPSRLAEYMTAEKMALLGPDAEDRIVRRDPTYVPKPKDDEDKKSKLRQAVFGDELSENQKNKSRLRSMVRSLEPQRVAQLLEALPPVLQFYRKPNPDPRHPASSPHRHHTPIFGSVSFEDIANTIRAQLRAGVDDTSDGALVRVEPRDIAFVEPVPPALRGIDRVKTLGKWPISIAVRGGQQYQQQAQQQQQHQLPPVQKELEVLAQE